MSPGTDQIGFSQRIRLEWLERTAHLVLAGNDEETIGTALQELLHDSLSVGGQAERGNREKAITILMKIWVRVPARLHALRAAGLELLRGLPAEQHIAVHWGMAMAVYPFWGAVAGSVGRLLRLQGSAAAMQIQRRVREQYGERETVSRATRRVIRSLVDWEVLAETARKGIYGPAPKLAIEDPHLIAWLVEASLHASTQRAAAINVLLDSPALFPFRLAHLSTGHLATVSHDLEVVRHGLDDDLVMLRGAKTGGL